MTNAELLERFKKRLAESGLTTKQAERLGLVPMMEPPEVKYPRWRRPGVLIPYHDLKGKLIKPEFWRFRFFDPIFTRKDKLKGKSGLRYIQPSGSHNQPYYPNLLNLSEVAKNPSIELDMPEGEFKAAAGAAHKRATIAWSGVWFFRAAKRGEWLNPRFVADWVLKGRRVNITYDSDVEGNLSSIAARNILALELAALGAIPYIVRLPALSDVPKTGLDDLLLQPSGEEDYARLREEARRYEGEQFLNAMNEQVVLIDKLSAYFFLPTNTLYQQEKLARIFKKHPCPNPANPEKSGDAVAIWTAWRGRAEAKFLTFDPALPPLTIQDDKFNTWAGFDVEPAKGSVTPFIELLDWVFSTATRAERDWFLCWAALPIQNPGIKLQSCVFVWSAQEGTGKGLIGRTLRTVYGKYGNRISTGSLVSTFTTWAENRLFIQGDEITGDQARQQQPKLRGYITDDTIQINTKNIPEYEQPNLINFYFTSNEADAFFLKDVDRRFFVHHAPETRLDEHWGREKREEYLVWLRQPATRAALLYYLLEMVEVPASFDHTQPPVTDAKRASITANMTEVARWIGDALLQPDIRLPKDLREILLWTSQDWLALVKENNVPGADRFTSKGISDAMKSAELVAVKRDKKGHAYQIKELLAFNHHNLLNQRGVLSGQGVIWTPRNKLEQFRSMTATQLANEYNRQHAARLGDGGKDGELKRRLQRNEVKTNG